MKNDKYIKLKHGKIKKEDYELLSQYYDLDNENQIATINLYYDKVSDVFIKNYNQNKKPTINEEVFENIKKSAEKIPLVYTLKIRFIFNNLEDFFLDELKEDFYSYLAINDYYANKLIFHKSKLSLAILLIGVLFLILNALLKGFDLIINFSKAWQEIISEILDITAWVFVWEAVTIFYFERNGIKAKLASLRLRVHDIEFIKAN